MVDEKEDKSKEADLDLKAVCSFFEYDQMSYAHIDSMAASYDFSEGWAEEDGWELWDTPSGDDSLISSTDDVNLKVCEDVFIRVEVSSYAGRDYIQLDIPDVPEDDPSDSDYEAFAGVLDSALIELGLEELQGECDPGESMDVYEDHGAWDDLCGLLDIDPHQLAFDSSQDGEWDPMMNIIYPMDRGPLGDDHWSSYMANMTMVVIGGDKGYLALTGGGMDFSWEICETYLKCGYLPPVEFASNLPLMASRGQTTLDRMILAGCRESISTAAERAEAQRAHFEQRFPYSDHRTTVVNL